MRRRRERKHFYFFSSAFKIYLFLNFVFFLFSSPLLSSSFFFFIFFIIFFYFGFVFICLSLCLRRSCVSLNAWWVGSRALPPERNSQTNEKSGGYFRIWTGSFRPPAAIWSLGRHSQPHKHKGEKEGPSRDKNDDQEQDETGGNEKQKTGKIKELQLID